MIYKFLVNAISALRIILSIFMVVSILSFGLNIGILTILFVMICISDFMDGRLARKFKVESKLGAILDVVADLFFIMIVSEALVSIEILPVFVPILMGVKFIEFLSTSLYVKKRYETENVFVSDKIGRIVAVMFYIIPYIAIVCAHFEGVYYVNICLNLFFLLVFSGALLSSMLRIKDCISISSLRHEKVEMSSM